MKIYSKNFQFKAIELSEFETHILSFSFSPLCLDDTRAEEDLKRGPSELGVARNDPQFERVMPFHLPELNPRLLDKLVSFQRASWEVRLQRVRTSKRLASSCRARGSRLQTSVLLSFLSVMDRTCCQELPRIRCSPNPEDSQ